MIKTTLAGFALAALIGAGAAFAQATTPFPVKPAVPAVVAPAKPAVPAAVAPAKPAAPAAAAAAKPAKADRTAISKQCSAQADAKGLHGKDRKKFREECKKSGGKA